MKYTSLKYIAFGLFALSPLSQAVANQTASMRFSATVDSVCGVIEADGSNKQILFKGESATADNSHRLVFVANKNVNVDFSVAPVRQLVKASDDGDITDELNLIVTVEGGAAVEHNVGAANISNLKPTIKGINFSKTMDVALQAKVTEKHKVKPGSYEYIVTATISCYNK